MTITCAIFAGGKATRMGGLPKGLEKVGDATILEHVARVLGRTKQPRWLSLARANAALQIPHALKDWRIVLDAGEGPALALAAILEACFENPDITALVTAAWDCPFLPADLIDRLHGTALETGLSTVAQSGGRDHPTIACWLRADAVKLLSIIKAGENRLHALLSAVEAQAVAWPDQPFDPFFNVNTLDDLAHARAIAGRNVLDLTGLKCPLPVLRSRKRLQAMPAGAMLEVIATDPMAAIDIPHFLRQDGHQLLGMEKQEKRLRFLIQCSPSQTGDGLG